MASNVQPLHEKGGETEKITINLGYVDLGRIGLLVQERSYSNLTDFIRTAIRNQLAAQADAVTGSIEGHTLELSEHNRPPSKAAVTFLRDTGE